MTGVIELVPHAPAAIRALIESVEAYQRSFGIKAAPALRDFFVSGAVSPEYLAQLENAAVADPWTHGFAVVHLPTRTVIGSVGYKGPPDAEGTVEIAYAIVPEQCGKGYATAAAQLLVERAFGEAAVRRVRAHTLPQPNASTRVLTKCGFKHMGEVIDSEDGRVWRWERNAGDHVSARGIQGFPAPNSLPGIPAFRYSMCDSALRFSACPICTSRSLKLANARVRLRECWRAHRLGKRIRRCSGWRMR